METNDQNDYHSHGLLGFKPPCLRTNLFLFPVSLAAEKIKNEVTVSFY